jgi:hypothetical protein
MQQISDRFRGVSDRTARVDGSDQLGVELFVLCFQGIRDLQVHCHSSP